MAATLPITANIGYSSQKTDICVILHQFRLNSPWKVGIELSWRTHSRIYYVTPGRSYWRTRHKSLTYMEGTSIRHTHRLYETESSSSSRITPSQGLGEMSKLGK